MKIPKIEYAIYSKLNGNKLIKLNISVCKNTEISIILPLEIKENENLDELNTSSGYYNNICYSTTSESGTDILLKDRKKEFIDKNKAVCQDDCVFYNYNYTTKKVNCSCKVNEIPKSYKFMHINKNKLFKNLVDIRNIANINILKCYKNLFTLKGILYNIGSYIIIAIIIFHFISTILFYLKEFNIIKKKIKKIKKDIHTKEKKKTKKFETLNINKNNKKNSKNISHKNNKSSRLNNKIKKYIENSNNNAKKFLNIHIYKNKKNNAKNNKNKINKKYQNLSDISQKKIITQNDSNNIKVNNKIKTIMKYTDDEKNLLSYKLALKYDKRTYIMYYISLLKTKHSLIFSFFQNNDYNSKIVKIDLFFIGFSIYYTVNCLFFNDDTMHKIYETNCSFNVEYQISKIIYSSLISTILNILLKLLALSNDIIIEFKQKYSKKKFKLSKKKHLEKNLSSKFISYFILGYIFLLCFWYYIAMFGVIYKNTQIILIEDTLISFGLSLIYPFFIYLLPGFFRIPAISNPKKNKECLYNFSKLIQNL